LLQILLLRLQPHGRKILSTPVPGDIYNPTTGHFIENPIAGQVHMWRVIVSYSGKNNGSVAFVTVNLSNPVPPSTFSIDQTAVAPNGVTSGNLVFIWLV
jgi:hypothetical protein